MADYISPVFSTGQEVDEALTAGLQSKSALVELVDGGAKNRLPFNDLAVIKTKNTDGTWNDNAYTWNGITFTINSDFSVSADGTATGGNAVLVLSRTGGFSIEEGSWILSGCPEGGSGTTYNITIAGTASDTGNTAEFTAATSKLVRLYIVSGTTADGLIFKPMVCSKAEWDISQAYQPYRPSYQELYERILALEGGTASLSMASPQSIEESLDATEIPEEGSEER
jgi:hypothetical protein